MYYFYATCSFCVVPTALIYLMYRFLPICRAYGTLEQVAWRNEVLYNGITNVSNLFNYPALVEFYFFNVLQIRRHDTLTQITH